MKTMILKFNPVSIIPKEDDGYEFLIRSASGSFYVATYTEDYGFKTEVPVTPVEWASLKQEVQ